MLTPAAGSHLTILRYAACDVSWGQPKTPGQKFWALQCSAYAVLRGTLIGDDPGLGPESQQRLCELEHAVPHCSLTRKHRHQQSVRRTQPQQVRCMLGATFAVNPIAPESSTSRGTLSSTEWRQSRSLPAPLPWLQNPAGAHRPDVFSAALGGEMG